MFAEERLGQIIELLNEKGKVVVKELSSRFNVTEDCIRKDLKTLEKEGLIKRTYGGAVMTRMEAQNNYILTRKEVNADAKEKIAEKAFELIEPMETIFFDISTTNLLIAEKIAAGTKKLTVVTNMLDIVKCFTNNPYVEVICIGGVFSKDLSGFIGSTAIEGIEKYKFNKAFIGTCGVDIYDMGVTTFDVEDGNTKKAIMRCSRKAYLVMEAKKFHIDGVYKFASLYDFDCIILDGKPEGKIGAELNKLDIDVI